MENTSRPSGRTRLRSIPAVIRRYARAERALAENGIAEYELGIRYETAEFLRRNRESYEADLAVPPRLRWLAELITRWIIWDLDYWRRTGQS